MDQAPEDPPTGFPPGAGGLACLQNHVGLVLDFLEDEVANFCKCERVVSVPKHTVSEDEIRSLLKRCGRNQAPEPSCGSETGLDAGIMFENSKEIQQIASG